MSLSPPAPPSSAGLPAAQAAPAVPAAPPGVPQLDAAPEQLLAAIVESSFDAVISKALDGTITSWNAAAETLFGWRREEMLGASVLRLIPDDRQAEELRILATIGRGERVAPFDTLRRRRDGSLVEVSVTVSPVRDRQGRIVGASKVARDIGPQRRLERLEQENREVLRAAQLKSRFLASMSHELRTPLNAVIGFADLLLSGSVPPDSPKYPRFLGHIASSGRHLLQLINDVLDLTKVEAGKLVFAPEPLSPQALVRHVIELMQPEARRRGVHLLAEPPLSDAPAEVLLDAARLKQVLFNLLSNALKFTPGGGQVSVHLRADAPGWWRLEVHDTGRGIAEADLSRLFIEFQQIEGQQGRAHEGTGLGLALTRRIVEAQGGQVGVRSRLGQGSVFHVRLPCDARPPADGAGTEAAAQAPLRLMVVEPDATTRTEIQRLLAPQGWQVQGAATAATARALWRSGRVDAMTLGLALPDEPALGLLSDLRGGGGLPPGPVDALAPVLGVSLPADDGRGAALLGVADVLFKPLRPGELAALTTRLRQCVPQAQRVLVVDDDPLAQELLRTELEAAGLQVQAAPDATAALAWLQDGQADALVLDLMLPGIDGFMLLDALQSLPRVRDLPVFVWTAALLSQAEYALLARSAAAIVAKGGGTVTGWAAQLRRVLAQRVPAAPAGPAAPR